MSMKIKAIVATAVSGLLLLGCQTSASAATGAKPIKLDKPNIIYILTDDLGYGDPGIYNPESKIPTPNIDRIARQGMRFTNAHTPSSVCTPTRYSVLTGRYAWRSRLKSGVLHGSDPTLIEPGRETVQFMLQKAGYTTAGIGKWHLGLGDADKTDYSKPLRPGPISSGFDYYFGIPASLDMPPYLFFENETPVQQATEMGKGKRIKGRKGLIAPDFEQIETNPVLTQRVITYLEKRAENPDKPFFLYMPMPAPHKPWVPAPQFKGKSQAGDYGDFTYQTDFHIGQVDAALKRLGLAENTILVITSDNGAHWRPHEIEKYQHKANGNWRGMKASIYEGGHRVPFIVRWPGKVQTNSVNDTNISLVDLMATVAAINGIALSENAAEDSHNMLPTLLGQKTPIREATVYHAVGGMFAIQKGDWKFVDGKGSGGFASLADRELKKTNPKKFQELRAKLPPVQLYDLAKDPGETTNLYKQHPEIVKELKGLLTQYKSQGYSRPKNVRLSQLN
jgi:arylsulfatase A